VVANITAPIRVAPIKSIFRIVVLLYLALPYAVALLRNDARPSKPRRFFLSIVTPEFFTS
jgi:hypothetical protein